MPEFGGNGRAGRRSECKQADREVATLGWSVR
jgi:hypothetical protein